MANALPAEHIVRPPHDVFETGSPTEHGYSVSELAG